MTIFQGKSSSIGTTSFPCIMYCGSMTWFICIFVAVVTATNYSEADSITGFAPEVTVYPLRTSDPKSSTLEALTEVNGTAAVDRPQREQRVAVAESSTPASADGGAAAGAQAHSGRRQTAATAGTPTAPRLSPPFDEAVASDMSAPSPAPADSGATTSSQPHGNLSGHSSWNPTTAPTPTTPRSTSTTDDGAVSRMRTPPTGGSGITSATQQRSDHSEAATSAATPTPTPACPLPPPDDADVSRMRNLSEEQKGWWLYQATRDGKLKELRALLVAGADVGMRMRNGWTALHMAALIRDTQAVRCLMEAGAEVDVKSSNQETPLHVAAATGRLDTVRLLLEAFSANPNARDEDGKTPLHRAAYYGQLEVVTTLLEAGADKQARDDSGDTPLAVTWHNKCQRLMTMLR